MLKIFTLVRGSIFCCYLQYLLKRMLMKLSLLTTVLTSLFLIGNGKILAQYQQTLMSESWVGTGGQNLNFYHNVTETDPSRNVYVAGSTINTSGNSDIIVQKFDSDGDLLWQQVFNGSANLNDMSAGLFIDNSNNVYVTGTVTNLAANGTDLAVLKYNSSGTFQWAYYHNGLVTGVPDDAGIAITGNNSDKVFVTGASATDTSLYDFITIALDVTTGASIWKEWYDYADLGEIPRRIEYSSSGGGVVTVYGGSQSSIVPNRWEAARITYDPSTGAVTSTNRSVTSVIEGINGVYDLTFDAAGYAYIAGMYQSGGATGDDMAIYKLDLNLNLVWETYFDGNGLADRANGIRVDANGNVFVIGTVGTASQGKNVSVLKYNSSGVLLWNREYFGLAGLDDEGVQLAIADTNHIYFTASVNDNGYSDYKTFGIDAQGNLFGAATFNGEDNLNDKPDAITLDEDNHVIVTGKVQTGSSTFVNRTVKYELFERNYDFVYEDSIPSYLDNNLLIRFQPSNINTESIDKRNYFAGELNTFVDSAMLVILENETGVSWSKFITSKVHRKATTADSLSITRLGDTIKMSQFWSLLSIDIPTHLNINSLIDSLDSIPQIMYAERNGLMQNFSVTQDALFSTEQLGLFPNSTYANSDINVSNAWDIEVGQPYIKVGVLDNPINWAHEEFNGGPTLPPALDRKIGGGYNYFTNYTLGFPEANTNSYHGTKVAGIIGARRNNYLPGNDMNAVGVAGIAGGDGANTGVQLYSLAISQINSTQTGSDFVPNSIIIEAMRDGYSHVPNSEHDFGFGLDLINISWGGPIAANSSLRDEFTDCWRNLCAVVAARGNDGASNSLAYPACFNDDQIMTVIASGTDGLRKKLGNGEGDWQSSYGLAGGNNYVPCSVDFMAPGTVELISATNSGSYSPVYDNCITQNSNYTCFNGTSAAAPHVAGVAALMMSKHHVNNGYINNLAPEDVEQILEKTASNNGVYELQSGYGLIDANEALIQVDDPYYVYHTTLPTPIVTQISSGSVVVDPIYPVLPGAEPEGRYGVVPGTYFGYKRKYEWHVDIELPLGHTIIDWWELKAKIKKGAAGSPIGSQIHLGSEGDITINNFVVNINGNTASYDVTIHNWLLNDVNNLDGNSAIDYYQYPYVQEELGYFLSLHVRKEPWANINEKTANTFYLYPNPTKNILNIQIEESMKGPKVLMIVDLQGRVVENYKIDENTMNYSISTEKLTQGVYYCTLISENKTQTLSFVKSN